MDETGSKYATIRSVVVPIARRFLVRDWLPNGSAIRDAGMVIVPFAYPLVDEDKVAIAAGLGEKTALVWSDTELLEVTPAPQQTGLLEFAGDCHGDADDVVEISNSSSLLHHCIMASEADFYYFSDADLYSFYLCASQKISSSVACEAWARFSFRFSDTEVHETQFFRRFLLACQGQ